MKNFQTYAEIKTAEKKELEKANPLLKVISIPLDGEELTEATFIIAPPSRNVINAIAKVGSEGNIAKANNILLKNCVLGGDMAFIDPEYKDQSIFLTVLGELGELQKAKEVTVKKLY